MKKQYFVYVLLSILFLFQANAQTETDLLTTRKNKLNREYLRPSISTIVLHDGSAIAEEVGKKLLQMHNEQFDYNDIGINFIKVNVSNIKQLEGDVTNALKEMNVGKKIMKVWFPKFINKNEGYSFEVLKERGRYAATDNDVKISMASKRGKAILNNLGQQLIDRSYVVVYYLYKDPSDKKGRLVKANVLAYKLDFNEKVMYTFYDDKYYRNPNGIEECDFPLEYLMKSSTSNMNISSIFKTFIETGVSALKGKKEVDETKVAAETIYEVAQVKLGQKIVDFEVKTFVETTSQIKAKIGKKEGLRVDDRFDVMEIVQNDEGKQEANRVGVVRVKKVIDNRGLATGETDEKHMSVFYNFKGGGYDKGMTLVKNPDLGVGVSPIIMSNAIGAMLDYRTKFYPGLLVYLKGELPLGDKIGDDGFGLFTYGKGDSKIMFMNFSFGVIKEFQFARYLFASTGLGFGGYGASKDNNGNKYDVEDSFVEGLGRFGLQVIPDLQVYLEGNYKLHFGRNKDLFTKNVSPFGIGVGVRYSF